MRLYAKRDDAKEQGSESYCLVAAWKEPSPDDFDKVFYGNTPNLYARK